MVIGELNFETALMSTFGYVTTDEDAGLAIFRHDDCEAGCEIKMPVEHWQSIGSPMQITAIMAPAEDEVTPIAEILSGPWGGI